MVQEQVVEEQPQAQASHQQVDSQEFSPQVPQEDQLAHLEKQQVVMVHSSPPQDEKMVNPLLNRLHRELLQKDKYGGSICDIQ